MKINCVIVDDESKACQLLAGLLQQIPDIEVLETFTDPQAARLYVMDTIPDLIFLDISMPGLTGLEFIDSLKKARVKSEVVFVSGYDTYTLDAIRKEAFDYLLKPVSMVSLMEMVCRFKAKQMNKIPTADLCYGKLRFNTLQGFFLIDLADIVYAKADGNYSIVYLQDGTNKVITLNLGQMESRLAGFEFFRMDRSLIINLKLIQCINRKEHTCSLSCNGTLIEFPVNRTRIKQLVEMF